MVYHGKMFMVYILWQAHYNMLSLDAPVHVTATLTKGEKKIED